MVVNALHVVGQIFPNDVYIIDILDAAKSLRFVFAFLC